MALDETRPFGVKGLCALIKACQISGVSELKFRDLEVRFHSGSPRQESDSVSPLSQQIVEPAEMGQTDGFKSEAPDPAIREITDLQRMFDSPLDFEAAEIDRLTGQGDNDDYDQ